MKEYDALYVVESPADTGAPNFYQVLSLCSSTEDSAQRRARKYAEKGYRSEGGAVLAMKFVGLAPSGGYSNFIGKYQGQFIDEWIIDSVLF